MEVKTIERVIAKIERKKLRDKDVDLAVQEHIKELDLSNNMLIDELPECICNWSCLERLNLSHVPIRQLPAGIGRLKKLKSISLQFTKIIELPRSFYELEELEYLNLNKTEFNELHQCIGELKSLKVLKITRTRIASVPKEIGNLQSLEIFDATGDNELCDLPEEIFNIRTLRELNLEDTQISYLPSNIGNLFNLKKLSLHGVVKIKELPEEIGELKNLEILDLGATNSLLEMPETIGELENLKDISLIYSIIEALPKKFYDLKRLRKLDLRASKITRLPKEIRFLNSLEWLDISGTKIQILPKEVFALPRLQYLNLSSLNLKSIPVEILNLGLKFSYENTVEKGICLYQTECSEIDINIFKKNRKEIIKYYTNLYKVSDFYQKVVFLGDGGSGKTTIINRLRKDLISVPSVTREIDIFPYIQNIDGKEIFLNMWDMGSQVIRNFWHELFLTPKAIYVVVINAREDIKAEERSQFWLDMIGKHMENENVLLVINQMDTNEKFTFNETIIMKQYPLLFNIKRISARPEREVNDDGFKEFEEALYKMIKNHMNAPELECTERKFIILNKIMNINEPYISIDEYMKLCHDVIPQGEWEEFYSILKWLNYVGVIWYNKTYIILNLEWMINFLAGICECNVNKEGQILLSELLMKISEDYSYSIGDIIFLLVCLEESKQLKLCENREEIFVPFLIKENEVNASKRCFKNPYNYLRVRVVYSYSPIHILRKLMIHYFSFLSYVSNNQIYWRVADEYEGDIVLENNYLIVTIFSDLEIDLNIKLRRVLDEIREIDTIKHHNKIELEYENGDRRAWLSYERLLEMEHRGLEQEFNEEIGIVNIKEVLKKFIPDKKKEEVPMFNNCKFEKEVTVNQVNGDSNSIIIGENSSIIENKELSEYEIKTILDLLCDNKELHSELSSLKEEPHKFRKKLSEILSDSANIVTIGGAIVSAIKNILG